MEKVYRKKANGRYEEVGYNNIPDISDGIWMVHSKEYSKAYSSLFWKVGELKRPVDIVTHASLQTMGDDLAKYLMKLNDINSDEYKEAKEIIGKYLQGPISYYNVSASDLVQLFLRQIAIKLEKIEK